MVLLCKRRSIGGQPDEDQNEQQQQKSANHSSINGEIARCLASFSHHNLFDISHAFTRKIKINKAKKVINILLHNDKKLLYTSYFLLTMVPPVHVAFLGEAYEFCRQLPL